MFSVCARGKWNFISEKTDGKGKGGKNILHLVLKTHLRTGVFFLRGGVVGGSAGTDRKSKD